MLVTSISLSGRQRISLDRAGAFATLTLDHPPLNLLDAQAFDELVEHVGDLDANPPRALLVRARGKVVSGGIDVNLFHGLSGPDATRFWERVLATVGRLEQLPCPTIFAAHALTLTALFEIALACDLIVAARSAKFGLIEARLGLSPAMGGTQRLTERAGAGRAREFVMTGDLYDAATLASWGVVNVVVDDEELATTAEEYARALAEGPTLAHAVTKNVVALAARSGVPAADRQTPRVAGELFATADARRAIAEFVERGPGQSRFEGR